MIQTTSTNKPSSPIKKVVKIILIVLLTPVALIILLAALYFGTKPIFDKFDHDKFITLDTQMQKVYQDLETASNGTDEWKYKTVCSPNYTGWMTTGTYNCVVSISTEKLIGSVAELNELQSKYFPIVEASDVLDKSPGAVQQSGGFGEEFVVSLANKDYTEKRTETKCTYETVIHQTDHITKNDDMGSAIEGEKGSFYISLRCAGSARSSWYTRVSDTSTTIPE